MPGIPAVKVLSTSAGDYLAMLSADMLLSRGTPGYEFIFVYDLCDTSPPPGAKPIEPIEFYPSPS